MSAKLANWLTARGHEVRVHTGAVPPGNRRGVWGRLRRDLSALVKFRYQVFRFGSCIPGQLYEATAYIERTVRECSVEHMAVPYDLIVSRFETTASTIAAYWCARELELPWVASFNDPFPRIVVQRDNFIARAQVMALRSVDQWWLKRLLTSPDWRVFPSSRLLAHIFRGANESGIDTRLAQMHSSCIPHMGTHSTNLQQGDENPRRASCPRVIRYVGSVAVERDVSTLVQALEAWNSLETRPISVEFIGYVSPIQERILRRASGYGRGKVRVRIVPAVSPADAFNFMQSADALLLIEEPSDSSIYLPSKFCDYATARRPMLAITPRKSTVRDHLSRLGGGIAVEHGDVEGTFNALKRVLAMSENDCEKLAMEFTPDEVGRQWEDLLLSVAQK